MSDIHRIAEDTPPVNHGEATTTHRYVEGQWDCEIICACGEIVGGMGRTDYDAHLKAQDKLYEHFALVRRNRANHYLKVSKRAKEPW